MRRLLALPLLALLFAAPASAKPTCGVPQAKAFFETPEVQVWAKHGDFRACYRPTGRSFAAGYSGDNEEYEVDELLGGRYLSLFFFASADDYDVSEWHMLDLRTGKWISAVVADEHEANQVVVLAGALAVLGPAGLTVQYADGRKEVLDPAATGKLSADGAQVSWGTPEAPHTAQLELPPAELARALPRARTIGRCKPRPGARLVLHDGPVVVTRVGTTTYRCVKGKTRAVSVG